MLVSLLTTWFGRKIGVALGKGLPYLIGVVLCLVIRWDAYNDGVSATTLEYQELIQQEQNRQEVANDAAQKEAARIIQNLELVLKLRNTRIGELQRESAQDPNADRLAIGGDSVQRLNGIR